MEDAKMLTETALRISGVNPRKCMKDFVYGKYAGANLSKTCLKFNKAEGKTLVVLKPCDALSFNQLLKEHRLNRDKFYIIGAGCKGMEYAGYKLIRGCGCRNGFCGACATIYRIKGERELKVALACQTTVQDNMYVATLPFFPLEKQVYDINEIKPDAQVMGESTSLPARTADRLLQSLIYSIGLQVRTEHDPRRLQNGDLEGLLRDSWNTIEGQMKEARRLLARLKACPPPVANRAWLDTLDQVQGCFGRYDYRFFAHEVPCSIDYPLCQPADESLQGMLSPCTFRAKKSSARPLPW